MDRGARLGVIVLGLAIAASRATRRWKLGIDYGVTNLDRLGLQGLTQAVHLRTQWVY